MKVIAIQGSPHRGNTYDRVEDFERAVVDLGNVEFTHIPLCEIRLEGCRGCFLCFSKGEESCPISDDLKLIREKIEEADAVVFATPVYSMHISYLMKLLVDRLAWKFHRPSYFGKYAVGLAVTGAVGLRETLKYIQMFSEGWGFQYAGSLRHKDPPRNTAMPQFKQGKSEVRDLAEKLHRLMLTNPPRKLRMNDHLMFHAMRTVYSRMKEYSPADYEYWKSKGWLDPGARYFTENARVGFLKSIYPRLLSGIIGRSMDKSLSKSRETEK